MGKLQKDTNKKTQYWMFTLNNPPENFDPTLLPDVQYMVWQNEKGEEETEHIQGYIVFKIRKKFTTVKTMFLKKLNVSPNLQPRKGSHQQAKDYCSKEETRVSGPNFFGNDDSVPKFQGQRTDHNQIIQDIKNGKSDKFLMENYQSYLRYFNHYKMLQRIYKQEEENEKFKENVVKYENLYPWQKFVLKKLETQPREQILWITDTVGLKGKTELAKYLRFNLGAFYTTGGLFKDVNYEYDFQKIIVFDFTRHFNKEMVNYGLMEQFKNGIIKSSKYESCEKTAFNIKVIVFSNSAPDYNQMSDGRIVEINLQDTVIDRKHQISGLGMLSIFKTNYHELSEESDEEDIINEDELSPISRNNLGGFYVYENNEISRGCEVEKLNDKKNEEN